MRALLNCTLFPPQHYTGLTYNKMTHNERIAKSIADLDTQELPNITAITQK
jgi:hypothetical protein